MNGDLMRLAEVAKALRFSRTTVYGMIKRREIPVVKIGRRLMVPRRAYELWLTNKTAVALNEVQVTAEAETPIERGRALVQSCLPAQDNAIEIKVLNQSAQID